MNNEDNVYELLGNVQILTKEGVETKFEELEESLPQKINDALGTSLDEKIDEAVSNAVIDAGGVTPALLDEVKAELVATDTALQAADTLLDQRITALEAGGGSGGSTTDELLVLTLAVDVKDPADTTTWLLKEAINFDTLYQSYLAKTNKPVVINLAMSDLTGSTQYSFRDVITSAEDTQIRITGDAMSAVIAPNTRFTIDLALIKDEATGNCIVNTEQSKFLMQEDAGGGSGEVVSEKIFEFTGEYLVESAADEPSFTVNIDAIDSDKFKEAVDDNYKFQLCLRAPQTQMPIVITTYIYAIQGTNYAFAFNLDSLGMISNNWYGRVQIAVVQNEDTGNYELGPYGIDKGDDDSLNLVTLDKRVTALEAGGGSGGTDDAVSLTTFNEAIDRLDAEDAAIKDRLTELETREPGTDPSEPSEDNIDYFTFTGEYTLDDEGNYADNVNMDVLDSAAFTDALSTDKYFRLHLRSSATTIDVVVTDYLVVKQGDGYTFSFYLKQVGLEPLMSGMLQMAVVYDTETSTYAYDSIRLLRDEPSTPEEPDTAYTYIIDSQEKFDAFCVATNATEADGNDYSHVLIKNGNYTIIEGHAIRLDNEAVPILSITGESQEGVVITYSTTLFSISSSDSLYDRKISNMTLKIATDINTAYLITPYDTSGNLIESHVIFTDCAISTCTGFTCTKLQSCIVNLTITTAEGSLAKSSSSAIYYLIYCAYIYNTNITLYISAGPNKTKYTFYALYGYNDTYHTQNSAFENNVLQITHLVQADAMSFTAIGSYAQCINSSCILDDLDYLKYTCLFGPIKTCYSVGFEFCKNLTNCVAKNFKICFRKCYMLSNCSAYLYYACCNNNSGNISYQYSSGFDESVTLINCHVYGTYAENLRACTLLYATDPRDSTTANLKLVTYAYINCKNLISCYDDIRNIQYTAKCNSLQYVSYASCTNVSCCISSLASITATETLNTTVTNQHIITGFANCNSVDTPYFPNKYIQVVDGRDDKTTQLSSLPFNISHIANSRNISNFYIKENTYMQSSDTTVGDVFYYISKANAGLMNSTLQLTSTTSKPSFQITNTTGIQGCVLKAPDTSTCSASQTYVADYAVADTPAGGFNKIV